MASLAFVAPRQAPIFQAQASASRARTSALPPAAAGLAGLAGSGARVAAGAALALVLLRRGRTARGLGPRASTELLEQRSDVQGDQGGVADVKPWQFLSGIAKDAARAWFVQRAEERGIAWRFSVEKMQAQQEDLESKYHQLTDVSLEYPEYFRLPFHGYDEGNLSWRAAHELEAATQSMCLGYYDGMTWQEAQEKFRGAAREAIRDYFGGDAPRILDMGCSGGFSSQEMARTFPGAEVTGLDLSPYFLSVAKQSFPEINFVHANAESTGLPGESYDLVTLNFLLHELPLEASRNVVREAQRLLKPGGALVVLDVDPSRLQALPAFRRWAFQVTEPWCKEGEYFSLELPRELSALGYKDVQQISNDPVNSLTLARKV